MASSGKEDDVVWPTSTRINHCDAPIVRLEGVVEREGGSLRVVPIGTQFTKGEMESYLAHGMITVEHPDSGRRRVLCPHDAANLSDILDRLVGKEVTILFRVEGPGLTVEESDKNELALVPDGPYVVWADYLHHFVCPSGDGPTSVVRGPNAKAKLAQLDEECSCGGKGHRTNSLVNKVSLPELEALVLDSLEPE